VSRITLIDTPLQGLKILQRNPISDSRGFLERMFCQETLKEVLGQKSIRQINHTLTAREGTIRGFHFQYPPFSEIKIVSCLKGEVWDVVVDIRKDSPTFLQSFGVLLNAINHRSLFIPEGFAHGFQTLSADCEMFYFHTQDYNAGAEGGLNVLDPKLAIAWPHELSERSSRDEKHPFLEDTFLGI
jgi:dTDP-4-dehydrorhamnose 3,5-epimerase